jgi:hypothetical protein
MNGSRSAFRQTIAHRQIGNRQDQPLEIWSDIFAAVPDAG